MTDSNQKQQSFEQALQQLEQLVNELEQGDLPLDISLQKFEQAIALSRASQAQLQQAEQKVKLLIEQNGEQHIESQEANE